MQVLLNKKKIAGAFLFSALVIAGGCSGKTDAQAQTKAQTKAQTAKANDHGDHTHGDAPKMAAVTKSALPIASGNYTMDKTHGYVTFSYLHKGLSHPQLRFNDVDAQLVLDAAHPENSQVSVTIQAANIDTGVAKFDTHITSPDFFDVKNNPTMTFKSTSFTRANETSGTMTGDMTMMGVTKSVTFDVDLVGVKEGDKPAVGVDARTKLNRSDFNLGAYVPVVGDEITIVISAEFHKD